MKYLLITLTLFNLNLMADKKTSEEYWRDTGLKFTAIEENLDKTTCEAEETGFLACMMGLSAIYGAEKPALQLLPKSLVEADSSLGKVVDTIDDIVVIEPAKFKTNDILEQVKHSKALREKIITSWKNLFKNINKLKVDYSALVSKVKALKTFKDNEAHATARALNSIYSIAADPHTKIIPRAAWEDMSKADANAFYGMGAQVKKVAEKIILSPMRGSPALKAGVKNGDVLTHVDGNSIEKLELEEITGKIKGLKGTTVKITIVRPSEANKQHEINITRDLIKNEPVFSEKLDVGSVKVGYTRLDTFVIDEKVIDPITKKEKRKPVVCSKYKAALSDVINNDAIILDVRNNGGGYLTEAVCIANLFLEKGDLVLTARTPDGKKVQETHKAKEDNYTQKPFILLQDAGSASASELIAGAFQDHERAIVMGVRSYGKGTIQQMKLLNDKILIAETTGRFHMPSDRTNQVVGIIPDIIVYNKPNPTELDKFFPREEDYYTALPALGTPWVQPRPGTISKMDNCMKKGSADKDFVAKANDPIAPDYQLLKALDAAKCMVEENLAIERKPTRQIAQDFSVDSLQLEEGPIFIEKPLTM